MYQTTQQQMQNAIKGAWNLPHLTQQYDPRSIHSANGDYSTFNKTQCNETRYLKHLTDTRVTYIMRSNKEFSMGNVPSK